MLAEVADTGTENSIILLYTSSYAASAQIHAFVRAFSERLLCTSHALGTGDRAGTKTDRKSAPSDSLEEETDKKPGRHGPCPRDGA